MKALVPTLLALLALILAAGCDKSPAEVDPNAVPIRVTVTYRERLLLPPDCTLTVTLENVSNLDARAEPIATASAAIQAAPPFALTLRYDPLLIHDRLHYGLRARIELNGQLLFTNTARIDPFAQDQTQPIEIPVQRTRK